MSKENKPPSVEPADQFREAIDAGDFTKIQNLSKQYAYWTISIDVYHPIVFAARRNQAQIVVYLLANSNVNNHTLNVIKEGAEISPLIKTIISNFLLAQEIKYEFPAQLALKKTLSETIEAHDYTQVKYCMENFPHYLTVDTLLPDHQMARLQFTPLRLAVNWSKAHIVTYLLLRGSKVTNDILQEVKKNNTDCQQITNILNLFDHIDSGSQTALLTIINYPELVLWQYSVRNKNNLLIQALKSSASNKNKIIEAVLQAAAKINQLTQCENQVNGENKKALDYILNDLENKNACIPLPDKLCLLSTLYSFYQYGSIPCKNKIIQFIYTHSNYLFCIAIQNNSLIMMEWIYDISFNQYRLEIKESKSSTLNHLLLVNRFLFNTNKTALQLICSQPLTESSVSIIRFLLKNGADLLQLDDKKQTPLATLLHLQTEGVSISLIEDIQTLDTHSTDNPAIIEENKRFHIQAKIILAVYKSDLAALRSFLKENRALLNEPIIQQMTLLQYAIAKQRDDLLEILITEGVDLLMPNKSKHSPFWQANQQLLTYQPEDHNTNISRQTAEKMELIKFFLLAALEDRLDDYQVEIINTTCEKKCDIQLITLHPDNISQLEGCDFLITDILPTLTNLPGLPIRSNAAYILYSPNLLSPEQKPNLSDLKCFYVNKLKNQCIQCSVKNYGSLQNFNQLPRNAVTLNNDSIRCLQRDIRHVHEDFLKFQGLPVLAKRKGGEQIEIYGSLKGVDWEYTQASLTEEMLADLPFPDSQNDPYAQPCILKKQDIPTAIFSEIKKGHDLFASHLQNWIKHNGPGNILFIFNPIPQSWEAYLIVQAVGDADKKVESLTITHPDYLSLLMTLIEKRGKVYIPSAIQTEVKVKLNQLLVAQPLFQQNTHLEKTKKTKSILFHPRATFKKPND